MSGIENSAIASGNYQHDLVSMAAAETITFHAGIGTDTATDRYLRLPTEIAYGTKIMPTNVVNITKINGTDLKVAQAIGTGGWSTKNTKIRNITLQTGAADVVSVEMRG